MNTSVLPPMNEILAAAGNAGKPRYPFFTFVTSPPKKDGRIKCVLHGIDEESVLRGRALVTGYYYQTTGGPEVAESTYVEYAINHNLLDPEAEFLDCWIEE